MGLHARPRESWQHFIGHERFRSAFSFLAYLGDKPVGMLIAHEYDAFRQATDRRECYIAIVAVTQAARGRGIASALIRRALAAAQADGCHVATLYVDADSPAGALTLYEHIGFTKQRTSVTLIKGLTDQQPTPVRGAPRAPAGRHRRELDQAGHSPTLPVAGPAELPGSDFELIQLRELEYRSSLERTIA